MPEGREPSQQEIDRRVSELLRGQGDDALDGVSEEELEAIERRLEEIGGSIEAERPAVFESEAEEADFTRRLADLEKRADAFRTSEANRSRTKSRELKRSADDAKGLGFGLTIAYTIIGMPIVGFGIGWLVDDSAGTDTAKATGMLIGAVIGIIAGVYLMNRSQDRK